MNYQKMTMTRTEYLELNQRYRELKSEFETCVRQEFKTHPKKYTARAEELYFMEYAGKMSEQDIQRICEIKNIINKKFSQQLEELNECLQQIIYYANNIVEEEEEIKV